MARSRAVVRGLTGYDVVRIALAVLLLTAALSGLVVVVSGSAPGAKSTSEDGDRSDSADGVAVARATHTLTQHLGIVAPDRAVTRASDVRNPTGTRWTLKKAVLSCSCTTPRAKKEVIEPGETVRFEIDYRIGQSEGRQESSVHLFFQGDSLVHVELKATATVRKPLSLEPRIMTLCSSRAGEAATARITVNNFSTSDWSSVRVVRAPDWIAVDDIHPRRKASDLARQTWDVLISAVSGKEGSLQGTIMVASEGGDATSEIAVTFVTRPVLDVSPEKLVFGRISRGQTKSKSVTMTVRDAGKRIPFQNAVIRNESALPLDFTWHQVGHAVWELEASLRLDDSLREEGVVSGEILIALPGPVAEPIRVPVMAMMAGD